MPHAVLSGRFLLSEWGRAFSVIHEQTNAWIIKVDEIYVGHRGERAIMPATVIEEGHPQKFYIRLSSADSHQRLTIRLDPATDPIKTQGVKRAIATVAEALLDFDPTLAIETHNLSRVFLRDDSSSLADIHA
ncbi:MAG: hypothetical protein P9L94_01505 [Candidatus Hinthialibacter antarcticus]|nr:hypothetical protein [Candidatus Hinthialibacter antarcticus]